MKNISVEASTASYIGKLLRDNFGKGPASVYVSIGEAPWITIYLKDFLAPMERILQKQGNNLRVEQTRDLLMQELLPEIKATLGFKTGTEITAVYYDWNLDKRTGVLLAQIDVAEADKSNKDFSFPGREALNKEVQAFSKKAEKEAEHLTSFQLNPRTIVSVRKGILVKIEEELIESGFEEQLQLSKRRLEKRLLDLKIYESVLGAPIEDFFVDWNFQSDEGYIVFILKAN